MTRLRLLLLALPIYLLTACGQDPAPDALATPTSTDFATRLEGRSAEDRARDAGRKPAEVISAVGIEPGMSVLEILAAGGWYTEVLSMAVGADGHVTAHNTAFALQMNDGANEAALSARLADGRLPNVSRLNKEIQDLSADDGQFDAAFTALNLHDIYNRGGEANAVAALTAIHATLRPGGFFVVIDHQGMPGADNAELHRMLKEDALRIAAAAGFTLELDSDVLHHPGDDMTRHIRDDAVRGKTHRFLLKLRKAG